MNPKARKVELAEGVAFEYERRSGLLRVHRPEGAVEVPLADLLGQLGVQAADVFPVRRYLLFAGRDDRRSGGMGDLVGLYEDEQEARAAFQRARLSIGAGLGWAHLVVMEPSGRLDRLCWFGREPDAASPVTPVPPAPTPERRRSWSRRSKQQQPDANAAAPPPPPPAARGGSPSSDDTRPILAAFSEGSATRPTRGASRSSTTPYSGGRRRW